ncbi:alpha/beta-hydrolase [Parathielavia appendiculata]|uniref:Alpha/beta-hydrolase n=1 Tax=Parathielavia appendiculata TaxID=2587402 RepID=A0AAN6TWD7_9PEZI|nr:alpha/beta-hydrolase [Parathielavia appendiculata]
MPKPESRQQQPSAMVDKVPILVASLVVGVPLAVYSLFLGLASIPYFQRNFLYAHKVHSLWWGDVNEPEQWGFAKNQVTPFHLTTADGQTLYAWHVLPLSVYAEHEAKLSSQPSGLVSDITTTENFRLLRDDPSAKLIVTFHGNAAQLTQGFRPAHYHSLTSLHSPYHVLAIDYRGFGLSTGSPTEHGLILDAEAAVHWAVHTAGIPPSRIALVGHSLGTAVASAASELFTLHGGMDFAGVVLVAAFSSLPEMLSGYAIAGWVPVLRPLTWWPWLLRVVMGQVVDKWDSAGRWRETVRAVRGRGGRLRLSLVHARNDWDIPSHEDDKLFKAAVEGLGGNWTVGEQFEAEKKKRMVMRGKDSFVATWREGDVVIRQEMLPHGGLCLPPNLLENNLAELTVAGHNSVLTYTPVLLAIMTCFGSDDGPAV